MNIKCQCGEVYSISMPKLEANLDVNIYTDGVVEGGSVPRDIKVFKCSSCGEYRYIAQCEKVTEGGIPLIEPTSEEYIELIKLKEFDTPGIRVKAWQRSNDRYRNIDSLEDVGVKIELLKAKIAEIPSVAHFDEYIAKMEAKLSQTPSEIIEKKIEELRSKREEVLQRVEEKRYLEELEGKQEEMKKAGEIEILYTPQEEENMRYLLEVLDDDGAGLLLKAEILRNLGRFEEAIGMCSRISEKHYENILKVITDLSQKNLKKVAQLRD